VYRSKHSEIRKSPDYRAVLKQKRTKKTSDFTVQGNFIHICLAAALLAPGGMFTRSMRVTASPQPCSIPPTGVAGVDFDCDMRPIGSGRIYAPTITIP